jgi:hypothetical protein
LRPRSTALRRTELDTLVDANGNFHPRALARYPHLEQYQPFSYGVSPVALGYNYLKKSQLLQTNTKQKHINLAETVIDNLPGLTLKLWMDEEYLRARTSELRAFGLEHAPENDREDIKRAANRGIPTVRLGLDARPVDPRLIDEAIFCYERANLISGRAISEYERHITDYFNRLQDYRSHLDHVRVVGAEALADAKYLRAMLAKSPEDRSKFIQEARAAYSDASKWNALNLLKYYTEPSDAKDAGYNRDTVDDKPLPELLALVEKSNTLLAQRYGKPGQYIPHGQDRFEFQAGLDRAQQRLAQLK